MWAMLINASDQDMLKLALLHVHLGFQEGALKGASPIDICQVHTLALQVDCDLSCYCVVSGLDKGCRGEVLFLIV